MHSPTALWRCVEQTSSDTRLAPAMHEAIALHEAQHVEAITDALTYCIVEVRGHT